MICVFCSSGSISHFSHSHLLHFHSGYYWGSSSTHDADESHIDAKKIKLWEWMSWILSQTDVLMP